MPNQISYQEIVDVAERLHRAYPYIRDRKQQEGVIGEPPLDALIRAILSQNTTDLNRDKAFASLRSRFPSWDRVADAPLDDVNEAIRYTNHAHTKADRIQQILRQLRKEHGAPTLDFLREWPDERIISYLRQFTGVGEKTAAIVCLFSLGRPVMPVDTHVFRVSQRLGWISATISPERAHHVLQQLIPAQLVFQLHLGLWEHGHTTCRPVPRCAQCAIYEYCLYTTKTAPQPPVDEAIARTSGSYRKAA